MSRVLPVICFVAVTLWFWLQARDVPHFGRPHDDSLYLANAISLSEGRGYRMSSLPGSPAVTKYPPLYSVWLAAWSEVLPPYPNNLPWLSFTQFLLAPFVFWLAIEEWRTQGLGRLRWVLAAFWSINFVVVYWTFSLTPDLATTGLVLLTVMFVRKQWATAAGLSMAAAYLLRSAALPLTVAVLAVFLLRRDVRRAAIAAASGVPLILAWMIWQRAHLPVSSDATTLYYLDYLGWYRANVTLSELPTVVALNTDYFVNRFATAVFVRSFDGAWVFFTRLLAAAAIIGAWRMARNSGQWTYAIFGAGYIGLLLSWNFPPSERLQLLILPLMYAGLAFEMRHLANLCQLAWRKSVAEQVLVGLMGGLLIAAIGGIATGAAIGALRQLPAQWESERTRTASLRRAFAWIRENTPASATFASHEDPQLFLETGRRGWRPMMHTRGLYSGRPDLMTVDLLDLSGFCRRKQLTHLLVTPWDHGEYFDDEGHREYFRRIRADRALDPMWEDGGFIIYRVLY